MTLCCIHIIIICKGTTWSYSRNTCDSFCLHIINSNKLFYPEYGSILGCDDVQVVPDVGKEFKLSSSQSSHHED